MNDLHLHPYGELKKPESMNSTHDRCAMPDYLDVETWACEDEHSPSGKPSIDELVQQLVISLPCPVYLTHA